MHSPARATKMRHPSLDRAAVTRLQPLRVYSPTPVKSAQSIRKKQLRLVLTVALSVLAGKAKVG